VPKQTKQSAVFGDLGTELNEAHKQVAGDDVDYGAGGDLPGGIENGIARLKECKFDRYKSGTNEGKWYFLATGVVCFPEHAPDGTPITNRSTMIMEPLCNTPTRTRKTVGDHWKWIRNELLKLGLKKENITPDHPEKAAAQLKKAKPHFSFRTWQGDKEEIEIRDGKVFVGNVRYKDEAAAKAAHPFAGREPMVLHLWGGVCDAPNANPDVPEEAMEAMVDSSEPAEPEAPEETTEAPEAEEAVDVAALVAEADDQQDKEAAKKLKQLALDAGVSQDAIDNADSWADVANMFMESGQEGEADAPATGTVEEGPDWEALGSDADEGVDDAINSLDSTARARGLDPDLFSTWAELAAKLAKQGGDLADDDEGETEDDGDTEKWLKVSNVVGFQGRAPSGKLTQKVTEVEVVSIDGDTITVRNLDTGAEIKGVDAEQLSQLV
jgi:hypothetical protein